MSKRAGQARWYSETWSSALLATAVVLLGAVLGVSPSRHSTRRTESSPCGACSPTQNRSLPTGRSSGWLRARCLASPRSSGGTPARPRTPGVAPLSAVLLGEGVYGLQFVADTTSPIGWTLEIVLAVVFMAIAIVRGRWRLRAALVAVGVWLACAHFLVSLRGGPAIALVRRPSGSPCASRWESNRCAAHGLYVDDRARTTIAGTA